MTAEIVHVVAGIIVKDDRIFVAKRKPGGPAGGFWEFPGGKLEAYETPRQALVRELREELSLDTAVGESIGAFSTEVGSKVISLDCYWATITGGTLHLSSHTDHAWLHISDLPTVELAAPDIPVLKAIQASGIPT